MGDVLRFPARIRAPQHVVPARPASAPLYGCGGWPDGTPVTDKLTGRRGIVTGRNWVPGFSAMLGYTVRWEGAKVGDIMLASRILPAEPVPTGAIVRLPDGRTLRHRPASEGGGATWVPAPEFDEPPPSAA